MYGTLVSWSSPAPEQEAIEVWSLAQFTHTKKIMIFNFDAIFGAKTEVFVVYDNRNAWHAWAFFLTEGPLESE